MNIYDELDSFNYDDSLFDHSEDDKPSFNEIGSNHRRLATPKVSRKLKHFQIKYSNAKKLAQDIDLVNNDRYDVILAGNFIYGDFLQFLFYENMIQAKEMFVSTLSMSYDNVYAFKNLIEKNYLLKLDLIVSDYFFSHERNKIIKAIYEELDIDNKFQLSTAQTHSKVCFFETHTGDKIVIHGSANLSSSNNVEQITIEKNEQLYDFYKEFYSKIIEKYKTINKSVLTSTSKSGLY